MTRHTATSMTICGDTISKLRESSYLLLVLRLCDSEKFSHAFSHSHLLSLYQSIHPLHITVHLFGAGH